MVRIIERDRPRSERVDGEREEEMRQGFVGGLSYRTESKDQTGHSVISLGRVYAKMFHFTSTHRPQGRVCLLVSESAPR